MSASTSRVDLRQEQGREVPGLDQEMTRIRGRVEERASKDAQVEGTEPAAQAEKFKVQYESSISGLLDRFLDWGFKSRYEEKIRAGEAKLEEARKAEAATRDSHEVASRVTDLGRDVEGLVDVAGQLKASILGSTRLNAGSETTSSDGDRVRANLAERLAGEVETVEAALRGEGPGFTRANKSVLDQVVSLGETLELSTGSEREFVGILERNEPFRAAALGALRRIETVGHNFEERLVAIGDAANTIAATQEHIREAGARREGLNLVTIPEGTEVRPEIAGALATFFTAREQAAWDTLTQTFNSSFAPDIPGTVREQTLALESARTAHEQTLDTAAIAEYTSKVAQIFANVTSHENTIVAPASVTGVITSSEVVDQINRAYAEQIGAIGTKLAEDITAAGGDLDKLNEAVRTAADSMALLDDKTAAIAAFGEKLAEYPAGAGDRNAPAEVQALFTADLAMVNAGYAEKILAIERSLAAMVSDVSAGPSATIEAAEMQLAVMRERAQAVIEAAAPLGAYYSDAPAAVAEKPAEEGSVEQAAEAVEKEKRVVRAGDVAAVFKDDLKSLESVESGLLGKKREAEHHLAAALVGENDKFADEVAAARETVSQITTTAARVVELGEAVNAELDAAGKQLKITFKPAEDRDEIALPTSLQTLVVDQLKEWRKGLIEMIAAGANDGNLDTFEHSKVLEKLKTMSDTVTKKLTPWLPSYQSLDEDERPAMLETMETVIKRNMKFVKEASV